MDKRTHIILTALSLFYQKGIHSVGINEIISVAGVAKKTMYHHFASKDELLLLNISQPELNKIYFSKNTKLWKHLNKKKNLMNS